MPLRQLPFQLLRPRRDQEAEADAALARLDRMMQPMRLNDPLHIGRTGNMAVGDPLMDQDIVKAEIDEAVSCDPCAAGCCPIAPAPLHAAQQQQDRGEGEDHEIEVVRFPHAVAGAMMAGMQEPARPMHHPAVHDIGKALHRGDGGGEDQEQQEGGHGPLYKRANEGARPRIIPDTKKAAIIEIAALFIL